MLIVSHAGTLDFGGIMGRLQVVRNRYHRKQDQRQHGKRGHLHCDSGTQPRSPPAAATEQPHTPKGKRYCDPDEVREQFHRSLGELYRCGITANDLRLGPLCSPKVDAFCPSVIPSPQVRASLRLQGVDRIPV